MNTPTSRNPRAAAQRHEALNRRQFLRGVGACVALPTLVSALRPGARAAAAPLAGDGLELLYAGLGGGTLAYALGRMRRAGAAS